MFFYPILALMTAGLLSWAIMPWVIETSNKRNIIAMPNQRTEHVLPTPSLGGLGIFIGFVPILVMLNLIYAEFHFMAYIIAISILFIVGLWDDLKDLKPATKFFFQFAVSFIVALDGARITSLDGIFGIYELAVPLQYIITMVVIVGVTNSVNLIDGINGLAAGIIAMNMVVIGSLFILAGQINLGIVSLMMAGALIGFLKFNFGNAKIFMGDSGSLVLGFSLAYLGIRFLNADTGLLPDSSIPFVVGLMILPVFDTLRVFAVRIMKKRSPFSADKNHLHHLLIKTGLDHCKAALIMYTSNFSLIAAALLLSLNHFSSLTCIVSLMALAVFLSELLTIKRALMIRTRITLIAEKNFQRSNSNNLLKKI